MLHSAWHDEALLRPEINRAIFQIDQETSFDDVKEFINVRVFVPVIFTFDNSETNDRVVHLAQRLVPPLVGDTVDQLLNINQLKRPVQNV